MKQTVIAAGLGLALAAAPALAGTRGPADIDQFGRIGGALKRAQQFRELQVTDDEEQQLGQAVSERIRQRYGVVQDADVHRYVSLVGTVVAQASSRPDLPWTFIVLDVGAVNAFAAPGGYVHITRGALGLIDSEAELAGVLAHEIAHVTEKHTIRSIQKSKAVQMGAEETLSGNADLFERAVTATYDNIVEKGFGRADELESDETGIALANRAGYDPHGLGGFLTRLDARNAASSGKKGLFASHPEMKERLDRLASRIRSEKLDASATLEDRYASAVSYTPTPLTEIATIEAGASGLAGDEAPAASETTKPEEPKKKGLGLGRLLAPGGGEKREARVSGSASARGVDEEKDVKGGGNPTLVPVRLTAADIAAFKKEGGLG